MTSPKTITSNERRVCFVEVPEKATDFSVIDCDWFEDVELYLQYNHTDEYDGGCILPSGNWKLLGDSRELTEDQMKEICENNNGGYKNYNKSGVQIFYAVKNSYTSLKEANGIVDSKRYVVLIEEKN